MKRYQTGFTLIELVVVLVILGILAATAVPRFTDLTTQARQSEADAILGAVLSSSGLLIASNNGAASTLATIFGNTDVNASDVVTVETDDGTAGGPSDATGAPTIECTPDGSNTNITINVCAPGTAVATCTVGNAAVVGQAAGVLADAVCDN